MRKQCTEPTCSEPRHGQGLCQFHYDQRKYLGLLAPRQSPMERFIAKIDFTDTCWEWNGGVNPNGYGLFGVRRKSTLAHRVSYNWFIGEIPEGLTLDHLCRVRHCVNPDHLEPVTNRENCLRGISPAAINARKTHCMRGHEFTPENTRGYPGRVGRRCRACERVGHQQRYAASKA